VKVSVIIPVYKAEAYVAEAVASALAQPEVGEVLLIEDGSPDGSLAVCERLAAEHERVRLLRHPGGANRGAGATRNLGLREARCELVAFLDADDFLLPGRFANAVAKLEDDPSLDGVYEAVGTYFEPDEMRQWWREQFGGSDLTTLDRPAAPEQLFFDLVRGGNGTFHTNGITVRRRLLERSGLFPAHLRMCQDQAMWLKMAAVGRLAAGKLDEPVAMRQMHGENRIVKDRPEHGRWGLRMAWYVYRWGRRVGLERAKLLALVDLVLDYQRWLAMRRGGRIRYRFTHLWCLSRLLATWPGAWRSRRFGEEAARLMPGGVRRLVERCRPWKPAVAGGQTKEADGASERG